MSQRSDLIAQAAEAIDDTRRLRPAATSRDLAAAVVRAIATTDDWHLISSPQIRREDDPPIPDGAVPGGLIECLSGPQCITTVTAELDGERLQASGRVHRDLLRRAAPGYQEHADAQIGRDFLELLGYRLGVPGCGDVLARLTKAEHP